MNRWDDTDKGKVWAKEYHKEWYQKNKAKVLQQQREYLDSNPNAKARKNKLDRERALQAKRTIYGVLGGAKCIKCGITDIRVLQLDHINGGGKKDRKSNRSTLKILRLHRDNLDSLKDKYQVLCANCNWIKKHENNEKAYS